jgi:ribosomal protein L12E/L44/L45/RPP1/RPP2
MAETTAEVRRDIEVTRERMSDTLAQLEHKLNLMEIVRDHPWPALAVAAGAGFALANSRADVKAAAAAVKATDGASSKVGALLDDLAATLIGGVSTALSQRVDGLVSELKGALGAPTGTHAASRSTSDRQLAGYGEPSARSGIQDMGLDGSRSSAGPSGALGARAD